MGRPLVGHLCTLIPLVGHCSINRVNWLKRSYRGYDLEWWFQSHQVWNKKDVDNCLAPWQGMRLNSTLGEAQLGDCCSARLGSVGLLDTGFLPCPWTGGDVGVSYSGKPSPAVSLKHLARRRQRCTNGWRIAYTTHTTDDCHCHLTWV